MSANLIRCQKLATKLLSRQYLSSCYVNVMKLEYDKRIVFSSIQEYARLTCTPISNYYQNNKLINSCTLQIKDNEFQKLNIILYDETMNDIEINWYIAHEVAHVYLDHKSNTNREKVEAHYFAVQLLFSQYFIINNDFTNDLDKMNSYIELYFNNVR